MNGMKKLSVILMLFSLTACASRVQRTVYYEYRPPVSHASVHTTVHRYQPIEVTVYADRGYRGGLSTIRLVMVDGDYAEIPMRNRKGHYRQIFAHYHRGVLHFDADRSCRGIHGASRFHQDNGWHKGQMYTRVSAGKDYDLTGLKLKVRHVDRSRTLTVAKNGELRLEKDRHSHPEHAKVDNHHPGRDRPAKSVQKQAVAAKNYQTPDPWAQTVNRFNQASDQDKRHDPVAKVRESVKAKAEREKDNDPQNVKLSKNEPKSSVAQKISDERKHPSAKPNGREKPGMTQVDKANDRHQAKEKEKTSLAEKKQARKDRKVKKNIDEEDDSDEENSLDDAISKEKGKHRLASR